MLRLRKKRQETLARLKKFSKESHEEYSLEKERRQSGISQKGVLFTKSRVTTDSGNFQETKNNNSKLLNTSRTINLDFWEDVTYFEEKNNEENTKIVDMKANEEETNNPLPITQTTYRNSSYSLKNLPFFRRTFLPNNFVFAIALVFPKQTRFYLVQHKQMKYLKTKDTRFCRIRKRAKKASLCIITRYSDDTNKTKFNNHVITYS